jgi:plasmid replication initiation protein
MSSTTNTQVAQHNNLIFGHFKMGLVEAKIFTLMLKSIHKNDTDFKPIKIHLSEIFDYSMGGNAYKMVHDACDNLFNQELNLKKVDSPKHDFHKVRIVDEIMLDTGTGCIVGSFAGAIRPYLLQMKGNFTISEIAQLLRFKNPNSHRFYWLLKSAKFNKKAEGELLLELIELKDIVLGTSEKYKLYGEFKKYIITPVMAELAESDLMVEMTEKKKGKAVTHLLFTIKSKDNKELPASTEIPPEKVKVLEATPVVAPTQRIPVIDTLKQFKLSDPQIKYITDKVSPEDIYQTAYQVRLHLLDNKALNPAAYCYSEFQKRFFPKN